MPAVDVNRDRVDSLAEDLQRRYGTLEVERQTHHLPPEEFADALDHAREGYDGGAYAWVVRAPENAAALSETAVADRDDRHRALMILPRDSDEWGLPGGGREGDESFEEAAVREVREEAGVDCEVVDLWHLRRVTWTSRDDGDDRRSHSLHPFFDARYTGGSISIQPGEVNGAAWFAEPPERVMAANERRLKTWDPHEGL
jgi:8-oxo-dGTP diphosphatase